MCEIKEKYSGKTAEGYKVVLEVNDKVYSPATGIEYQVGQVPVPETRGIYHTKYFNNVVDGNSFCHKKKYKGLTAVYVNRRSAEMLFDCISQWLVRQGSLWYHDIPVKVKIVRMKLAGRLFNGMYQSDAVILGSKIQEIINEE